MVCVWGAGECGELFDNVLIEVDELDLDCFNAAAGPLGNGFIFLIGGTEPDSESLSLLLLFLAIGFLTRFFFGPDGRSLFLFVELLELVVLAGVELLLIPVETVLSLLSPLLEVASFTGSFSSVSK